MNILQRIDQFHKTRRGYLTFGVVELALTYIFVSIALDTASMWAYLASIILIVGTVLNFINLFKASKVGAEKHAKR